MHKMQPFMLIKGIILDINRLLPRLLLIPIMIRDISHRNRDMHLLQLLIHPMSLQDSLPMERPAAMLHQEPERISALQRLHREGIEIF